MPTKDSNGVAVAYGISSVDGSILPISIDPVTGRVLATITCRATLNPTLPDRAIKDSNGVATRMAKVNNSNAIKPITINNVCGGINCNLFIG